MPEGHRDGPCEASFLADSAHVDDLIFPGAGIPTRKILKQGSAFQTKGRTPCCPPFCIQKLGCVALLQGAALAALNVSHSVQSQPPDLTEMRSTMLMCLSALKAVPCCLPSSAPDTSLSAASCKPLTSRCSCRTPASCRILGRQVLATFMTGLTSCQQVTLGFLCRMATV